MESLLSLLPVQEPLSPYSLLGLMLGIVFCGAFITSGFGIGGGVLMTPLMIFILPPKLAIALLAPLMLLMAGTALRQYWKQWDSRHLKVLLPPALLGIWVGSYLLAIIPASVVHRTVGILAIAFGSIQLLTIKRPEWRERLRPRTWQGVGLGLASGISSALAHSGGIIFSFYLLPHSRTKETFVGTTVFIISATGLLKIGGYLYYRLLTPPTLLLSLMLLPALILGAFLGGWLNRNISHRLFLLLISSLIVIVGIRLVLI